MTVHRQSNNGSNHTCRCSSKLYTSKCSTIQTESSRTSKPIVQYIKRRCDTSGCKPVFDLIEYSLDLELPDDIVKHPVIVTLNQGTNDLVMWSNMSATLPPLPPPPHSTPCANENNVKDLFSDNVEQSHIDMHNMICIFMIHDGLSLQQAIDHVGEICKQTIDAFIENQMQVPSWGDDGVDRDVWLYVNSLQEWIVGSLH